MGRPECARVPASARCLDVKADRVLIYTLGKAGSTTLQNFDQVLDNGLSICATRNNKNMLTAIYNNFLQYFIVFNDPPF